MIFFSIPISIKYDQIQPNMVYECWQNTNIRNPEDWQTWQVRLWFEADL